MNLSGKKTYFTCIAAFLTVWVTYFASGGEGVTLKEALGASFGAAATAFLRHAITTNGIKYPVPLPLLLLSLSLSLFTFTGALTSCSHTAGNGVSFSLDPLRGACIVKDGYRVCYNPLTRQLNASARQGAEVTALTWDRATSTFRGTFPDGTAAVYDDTRGLRIEPALPGQGVKVPGGK